MEFLRSVQGLEDRPDFRNGIATLGEEPSVKSLGLVCVPKSATNREFQRWCRKRNEPLEAHMPTKQQAIRRRAGTSKPNLGQEEAELERTGKEQMSHMEKKKAGNTAQRRPTKRGTK